MNDSILLEHFERLTPEEQPIGIYAVDAGGTIAAVNSAACRLLERDRSMLVGHAMRDLYHDPADRDQLVDQLRGTHKKGKVFTGTLELWINDRVVYLRDVARIVESDGTEHGVLGFLADITEERRSYALLWLISPGIYRADADGRICYANPAFAQMLGYYHPTEIIGTPISAFYQSEREASAFADRLRNAVKDDESSVVARLQLRTLAQTPLSVRVEVRPFRGPDGRSPWREGIVTDITAEEAAEEGFRALPGSFELQKTEPSAQLVITQCSRHFAELFGYEAPEAIIGLSMRELAADPSEYDEFERRLEVSDGPISNHPLDVRRRGSAQAFAVSVSCVAVRRGADVLKHIGFVHERTPAAERSKTGV